MLKRSTDLATFALLGTLALAGCSGTTTATPPADNSAPAASETPEEQPAAAQGTRENPYPLGTTISSDDWDVVINSVTLGANDAVAAANMLNQPPDPGTEYIVINYTVTYKGSDANGQSPALIGVEYVTGSGTTVSSLEKLVVAPEPAIDALGTLYNGGSATGNTALQVPSPPDGVLAVRPGVIADKVFVAIQ